MSKKTVSQLEAALQDRIKKANDKLAALQKKHKLDIGTLAYKHGLHQLDMRQLDSLFSRIAQNQILQRSHHDNPQTN